LLDREKLCPISEYKSLISRGKLCRFFIFLLDQLYADAILSLVFMITSTVLVQSFSVVFLYWFYVFS